MHEITVKFADAMLYDRLNILSEEYSIPQNTLINIAVRRLLDEVEFTRNLRLGNIDIYLSSSSK